MAQTMTNSQIYKKTIKFSLLRVFWDIFAFATLIILTVAGFVIAESTSNQGLIGLGIGFVLGAIVMYVILHYIAFSYKAGQIAMMAKGVTEGKLPEDVVGEGKAVVKKRFKTVAAYYAVTGAIKGIFRQIGNAITSVGNAVGGDAGGAVGGTISSVIQTIVNYLCDCCLGWVFYRDKEKSTKATLEGAVLFFKHGKTLAKNLGRVFGIGLVSFVVIGGIFGVASYFIMSLFPDTFNDLSAKAAEVAAESNAGVAEFLSSATNLMIVFSVMIGVVFWEMLHSTFVRPFVLVGVLRNFIQSGIDDTPDEKSFTELDKKSSKFAKLHKELKEE